MADDPFLLKLNELGILYSKTKKYILRTEQVDPESRSNIAINKEQRDALDHLMKALVEYTEKGDAAEREYLCNQVDNARGHLFRAAYDALDGSGVSYKIRIDKAMEGISSDAISAVYPDYFQKHLAEINTLDEKLVEHRAKKDEQRTKAPDLDGYCTTVERLYELSGIITDKIPSFREWQRRDRRKKLIWGIYVPAVLILVSAAVFFLKDLYWWHHPAPPAIPIISASPLPTAAPSASPSQSTP